MVAGKPIAAALLVLAAPLSAQISEGETTPLFTEDDVLDITIKGPIRQIARQAHRSTAPEPAVIEAGGETHTVTLAARGKSRRLRENCRFPPLRVSFGEKPANGSLFHRQGRLKLVTHCRDRDASEQTVLREYTAYRLYNLITPESLRVRLVRATYIDGGKPVIQRLGFFIEDADDAARRLGLVEVDTGDIRVAHLDQADAARYALFQYMIGNTDWSLVLGPEGENCCHNSKLLGKKKGTGRDLVPVPYDFDNAGLVDAPYASPHPQLGTRSVTVRRYRGFCSFNDLIPAEAERLQALRASFEAEISATPHADPATKSAMLRYLAGFYDDIANRDAIEGKLLARCR